MPELRWPNEYDLNLWTWLKIFTVSSWFYKFIQVISKVLSLLFITLIKVSVTYTVNGTDILNHLNLKLFIPNTGMRMVLKNHWYPKISPKPHHLKPLIDSPDPNIKKVFVPTSCPSYCSRRAVGLTLWLWEPSIPI